jgi:small subunit ribosomal protein S17
MEQKPQVKMLVGRVVSDKMAKTVIVEVEGRRQHPIYKKAYKVVKKFQVHDESGEAHYGDTVEIVPSRPLSRTKHFRLLRVITKGEVAESAELKEIT